jgi:hypothetical protein
VLFSKGDGGGERKRRNEVDLVEDPTSCQTFIHDIESTFFTLLWMAILYLKSSWETKRML